MQKQAGGGLAPSANVETACPPGRS